MNKVESQRAYLMKVISFMKNDFSLKLTSKQIANRQTVLMHLDEYATEGVYAADDDEKITPVFKNKKGVFCALGYLLMKTGYRDLAENIAGTNNFIDVEEVEDFDLSDIGLWSAKAWY